VERLVFRPILNPVILGFPSNNYTLQFLKFLGVSCSPILTRHPGLSSVSILTPYPCSQIPSHRDAYHSSKSDGFMLPLFPPPLLVGFPEGYQVLYAPEPICHASSHSRAHSQCTVNLDEVVGEIIQSCCSRVILYLPAETIRQARIATHGRANRPILTLHK